jgi:hypothetical protein
LFGTDLNLLEFDCKLKPREIMNDLAEVTYS